MNLLDLELRAFDILGDDLEDPLFYDPVRIRSLMNMGAGIQRAVVGDVWGRAQHTITSGVGEYQIPSDAQRLVRVAFEDIELCEEFRSTLECDPNWLTRPGTPRAFTLDGLPFDKYRLVPVPDTTTEDYFEFVADTNVLPVEEQSATHGRPSLMLDSAGAAHTFIADPNVAGWLAERGSITDSPDFAIVHGGATPVAIQQDDAGMTLWYVVKAPAMGSEGDEVPIRRPWQLGPLWYALARTYEEPGDHHNPILAGFYNTLFEEILARGFSRAGDQMPRHVVLKKPIYGRTGHRRQHPGFPDRMTDPDGVSHELIW